MTPTQTQEAKKRALAKTNLRLALLLGSIALLALSATFFFWPTPTLPS